MDAILIQLGQDLGLAYSKSYLTLNGKYENFKLYINQYSNINSYSIKFPFKLDTPTADYMTLHLIDKLRSKYSKISKCTLESTTLSINLTGSHDDAIDISSLTDIINDVVTFATANALTSCCEICKCNLPTELHDYNNNLYLMCPTCNTKLQNADLNAHKKNVKYSNIITSIIGAIFVFLVVGALWVMISK